MPVSWTWLFAGMLLLPDLAHADWQYTRWGMSAEELEARGNGNIVRVAPGEKFNRDSPNGQRGSVLDIRADGLLKSGYQAQGILYTAVYYFAANKLVAVSLFPPSDADGIKTGSILEGIYGPPEREQRMGREEGTTGCLVRRRWRSEREGNLITFFSQCGSNYEIRYEPIPSRGGL